MAGIRIFVSEIVIYLTAARLSAFGDTGFLDGKVKDSGENR
jgi:hypothetical protein